ncbi:MAG: hypothetical protein IJK06_03470 [Clostridia bacterium]|jgi:hypothetical protein|nr:hypothetical protein [Clostridia bacterium]
MKKNRYQDPYTGAAGPDSRPPWMIPPKRRQMPKPVRRLLTVFGIIALIVLGIYIYMLFNPSVGRNVIYK